jgi:predicted metal-dependent enzyme (double-stranded beta helix superfamily)
VSTLAPRHVGSTELRRMARDLAGRPDAWRPHLPVEPTRRGAYRAHLDDDVEIWVLSWSPGHDTGYHDHGGSAAAIAVVEGSLLEERLTVSGVPARRAIAAGDVIDAHPEHVHRVRHVGGPPAVSIHVYSPPLREVGAYRVSGDGLLERTPLPGDHELGED